MTEPASLPPANALGDDLPPVQPPSAGFIIQLFVVPALIVAAVVGVWALFGRLAVGEQDWRTLVQDLQSSNPQKSKRAMFGLAQVLDNDQRLRDHGEHLAANPQIAAALAEQFDKSLSSASPDQETLSMQVYLSRALGLLDVPDATVGVLSKALDASRDVEVRKGAVTSLALIAGRALDRGQPLGDTASKSLVELSLDKDPALRRAAAFALGLITGAEADSRLQVLLEDADHMTAVNAAVALARQKSLGGFPVFVKELSTTLPAANDPLAQQDTLLIQKNVLKAIAELGPSFTPEQRAELHPLITPLANNSPEPRIRVEAQGALAALSSR